MITPVKHWMGSTGSIPLSFVSCPSGYIKQRSNSRTWGCSSRWRQLGSKKFVKISINRFKCCLSNWAKVAQRDYEAKTQRDKYLIDEKIGIQSIIEIKVYHISFYAITLLAVTFTQRIFPSHRIPPSYDVRKCVIKNFLPPFHLSL